ncbi:phage GP46 family protein [Brenneria populi subsp. brevivirga]|uniref:phage GP46 family protein n=1 Tax=Brenneria populi TaxID=1505588 RepID=UPI002E172C61|nr:phage GP46 family protein [Brenneria populi subsp. brevivirga]
MDNLLDPQTGDYAGTSTTTLANAVYLRLMTPLGSYWAAPQLGSKLHLLQREKDVARVYALAKQYSEEALAPLVDDGRASAVSVTTERGSIGWLILLIEVTTAQGRTETFKHPVRVI